MNPTDDNLKKHFVMLVQTQSIVADIRYSTFQAMDCLDDAIHVAEDTLHQALELLDKSLCELAEEFVLWHFDRGPKPPWLGLTIVHKGVTDG